MNLKLFSIQYYNNQLSFNNIVDNKVGYKRVFNNISVDSNIDDNEFFSFHLPFEFVQAIAYYKISAFVDIIVNDRTTTFLKQIDSIVMFNITIKNICLI